MARTSKRDQAFSPDGGTARAGDSVGKSAPQTTRFGKAPSDVARRFEIEIFRALPRERGECKSQSPDSHEAPEGMFSSKYNL